MRLLKLLRISKLNKALSTGLSQYDGHGSSDELRIFVRLLKVLFWVTLSTHLLACGFYGTGVSTVDHEQGSWVQRRWGDEYDDFNEVGISRYINSLYFAFITVTTVGFGDVVPVNDNEKLFTTVGTFFGTAVFAYFIAEVSSMAEEKNISSIKYNEKKESVEEFMRANSVPKAIRVQIRAYYNKSWAKHIFFDSKKILDELSHDISYQLSIMFKQRLVAKVPFLEGSDDEMINMIVARLTSRVYTPGEIIIEKGEHGTDMYFIDTGTVSIHMGDAYSPAAFELGGGAFFGEIALLEKDKPRSSTVIASGPCNLYVLTQQEFTEVIGSYPVFEVAFRKSARARLTRTKSDIVSLPCRHSPEGQKPSTLPPSTANRKPSIFSATKAAAAGKLKSFKDTVNASVTTINTSNVPIIENLTPNMDSPRVNNALTFSSKSASVRNSPKTRTRSFKGGEQRHSLSVQGNNYMQQQLDHLDRKLAINESHTMTRFDKLESKLEDMFDVLKRLDASTASERRGHDMRRATKSLLDLKLVE